MGIGQDTFSQISSTNDPATLAQIRQFVQTGDQDSSNAQAIAAIDAKMQQVAAAAQQAKAQALMVKDAQDYRKGLPQLQENMYQSAGADARQQLSQQMAGINQNANRRGLLYSGLKQGAQAGANQGYASGLSATRANINSQTEAQAQGLENQAIGAGVGRQQMQMQQSQDTYNRALQRQQQKQQLFGSAAGAVGGITGAAAAKGMAG